MGIAERILGQRVRILGGREGRGGRVIYRVGRLAIRRGVRTAHRFKDGFGGRCETIRVRDISVLNCYLYVFCPFLLLAH